MATSASLMGAPPNLPGVQVESRKYRDTMVLYTAMDKVECVVDGAPPGPNGRLFIVETDKAMRVPYEAGRFILEHLAYTGVVRVNETETETGVTYDIASAREESLAKGEQEDRKVMDAYIQYAVHDKIENKKPVPAPPEPIMRILKRRNIDLRRFGIVPLGFETPQDEEITNVKAENDNLKSRLALMENQMAALLKKKGKKAAAAAAEPEEEEEGEEEGDTEGGEGEVQQPQRARRGSR